MFLFFFFKQKTAYEMRISDWSSDVCSSDLLRILQREVGDDVPRADRVQVEIGFPALHTIGKDLRHIDAAGPVGVGRSEERRVGKECVSTCRSRWSPYH